MEIADEIKISSSKLLRTISENKFQLNFENQISKMANQMGELQELIRKEVDKLICNSHPNVCELRDTNYVRLESLLFTEILSEKHDEAPSIQTAIATIESEL